MAKYYNKGRIDREFQVDSWVYVKIQLYRQSTLSQLQYHKLAAKFYGPYRVIARIGKLAYKLELPDDSRVHPVFHVSTLKAARGDIATTVQTSPPRVAETIAAPQAILDRRTRNGRDEVLVHWSSTSPADASWEDADQLQLQFPDMIDS
ncbi:hypothetical protein LINGRAHAP2_LOCUS5073 [Linum grandiflorum]